MKLTQTYYSVVGIAVKGRSKRAFLMRFITTVLRQLRRGNPLASGPNNRDHSKRRTGFSVRNHAAAGSANVLVQYLGGGEELASAVSMRADLPRRLYLSSTASGQF